MSYSYPPTPKDALTVLTVGRVTVCCDPQPGFPGKFLGPPDGWEPPEPGDLGPIYFLAHSASKARPDRWIKVSGDLPDQMEDEIWKAFEKERDEAWSAYAEEINDERGLYG